MILTAYDRQTALRASLTAALAMVVAWLVAASTDEGGLAWSTRLVRVLPLSPGCAAIGTWAALARGRARGEALAVAALGRNPWQSSAAAVLGGAAVGLAAAFRIATLGTGDVRAFFPVSPRPTFYRFDGASFVDGLGRLRIAADGTIRTLGPGISALPVAGLPDGATAAAALAIAFAAVAFPLVAARTGERTALRAGVLIGATLLSSILFFHAAAVGLIRPVICPVPSILLLAVAAWGYRSS
jgi:hypothetical protein